jgi:hypothetical protein
MRPAPGVPDDGSLVRIRGMTVSRTEGRRQPRRFSMPEVNDLAARREAFSAVAAYARHELVLDLNDGTDSRPVGLHTSVLLSQNSVKKPDLATEIAEPRLRPVRCLTIAS